MTQRVYPFVEKQPCPYIAASRLPLVISKVVEYVFFIVINFIVF